MNKLKTVPASTDATLTSRILKAESPLPRVIATKTDTTKDIIAQHIGDTTKMRKIYPVM